MEFSSNVLQWLISCTARPLSVLMSIWFTLMRIKTQLFVLDRHTELSETLFVWTFSQQTEDLNAATVYDFNNNTYFSKMHVDYVLKWWNILLPPIFKSARTYSL